MAADGTSDVVANGPRKGAARGGLVSRYSPSLESNRLIMAFWLQEATLGSHAWLEWVASKSNIADGPTRDQFALLQSLGATFTEPRLPEWAPRVWAHPVSCAAFWRPPAKQVQ